MSFLNKIHSSTSTLAVELACRHPISCDIRSLRYPSNFRIKFQAHSIQAGFVMIFRIQFWYLKSIYKMKWVNAWNAPQTFGEFSGEVSNVLYHMHYRVKIIINIFFVRLIEYTDGNLFSKVSTFCIQFKIETNINFSHEIF